MDKSATLTLKIVNDQNVLDSFPMERELTEAHKDLIRFIARTAVEEYVKQQKERAPSQSGDRMLRLPQVEALIGLSRSTIYLRVNKGTFPQPIKLGAHSVGWKESQIQGWLGERQSNSE